MWTTLFDHAFDFSMHLISLRGNGPFLLWCY